MKYPEIFQEVKHRGHAVGNHTFNHVKGTEKTVKEYVDNVGKAHEYIHSKLFRPPHGRITLSQVNKLKADFKIIMWDFITYDFDRQVTSTEILKEVKIRSRNGSVVIFHDSLKARKNVLEALPEALRYWKKEGYEVKALHELTH